MESGVAAREILDWIDLGPIQQGSLIICAIVLVLTFLLLIFKKITNTQLLSFMTFALVVAVVGALADRDAFRVLGNQAPEVVDVPPPKETNAEAASVSSALTSPQLNVWTSGWFEARPNQVYDLAHNIGVDPIGASLWYRKKGSPQKHLMDGIFEGRGVGAFVMDVTSSTARVATGDSVSSGYGNAYNHWVAIDQGQPQNSQPRELQLVLFYQK